MSLFNMCYAFPANFANSAYCTCRCELSLFNNLQFSISHANVPSSLTNSNCLCLADETASMSAATRSIRDDFDFKMMTKLIIKRSFCSLLLQFCNLHFAVCFAVRFCSFYSASFTFIWRLHFHYPVLSPRQLHHKLCAH